MRNEIGVGMVTDRKFLAHALTATHSLLANNEGAFVKIFYISPDLSESEFRPVREFIESRHNVEPHLISLSPQLVQGMGTGKKVGSINYLKLFVPGLLPAELRYCFLLDADTVTLKPLTAIVDIANSEHCRGGDFAWAVRQPNNGSHLSQHGFSMEGYFNSGVMLIDLEQWRSRDLDEQVIAIEEKTREGRVFTDQDVFNICLDGHWKDLPDTYNFCGRESLTDGVPHIAHFCSPVKPWMWGCGHPNSRDYDSWRKQIPMPRQLKSGFLAFAYRKLFNWRLRKAFRRFFGRKKKALALMVRSLGLR